MPLPVGDRVVSDQKPADLRTPEPTPDLPPLPKAPAARRRALRVRGWLVAVAAIVAVALTACTPKPGPAGTVTDRDRMYWSSTKQWTYKLTVRKPDGTQATFKVLRGDYKACGDGEAYPACTGRSS